MKKEKITELNYKKFNISNYELKSFRKLYIVFIYKKLFISVFSLMTCKNQDCFKNIPCIFCQGRFIIVNDEKII